MDGAHGGRQTAGSRAQKTAKRHFALGAAVAGGETGAAPDKITAVLHLVVFG